jgi:uncharacterized Tic20 family protein
MAETPTPGPGPVNPTPPPTSPAPVNYGTTPPSGAPFEPAPHQDSKTMGMLAHLLGIFTGWVGPLIIWLIKREQSPFVNDQGKEALNWQLTIFIPYFVLIVARCFLPFGFGCVASILVFAIFIVNLIFSILGAVAASKGLAYRYPFTLGLIK